MGGLSGVPSLDIRDGVLPLSGSPSALDPGCSVGGCAQPAHVINMVWIHTLLGYGLCTPSILPKRRTLHAGIATPLLLDTGKTMAMAAASAPICRPLSPS